jgi:hypothetical protein
MNRNYGYDIMEGQQVPQLVIDHDHVLTDHTGTVHVEAGNFVLEGTLRGNLDIQHGVLARISGKQQGTVSIASGASVLLTGAIEGPATVEHGAVLVVESGARLAGSLANQGTVIVRGVFGGARSGRGTFRLERSGHVKEPSRAEDGSLHYDWTNDD